MYLVKHKNPTTQKVNFNICTLKKKINQEVGDLKMECRHNLTEKGTRKKKKKEGADLKLLWKIMF